MKKIPSVKGTRDLYPDDYRPIKRIFDAWRETSILHGFEEFDGPTLEFLELYQEKSGDELVGQLFRLTDQGGRELALRPEMTPTLARMVAAKINALAKPIKWFCIPNLFRGENVQRGRLREFFQWNVDVIGSNSPVADAEVMLVGIEALRRLGLTEKDFRVHISNRQLIAAMFTAAGLNEAELPKAYALLDKAAKVKGDALGGDWDKQFGERLAFEQLMGWLEIDSIASLRETLQSSLVETDAVNDALAQTQAVLQALASFGVEEYCKLDLKIVRGLAYYTGPVFEFFDTSQNERAICGGGRYDDLLGKLGKQQEPAIGFGMGDVVLALLLEEKGLLDEDASVGGVVVIDAVDGLRDEVMRIAATLRRAGILTSFGYQQQALGRQLKQADKRGCHAAVILGDETKQGGECQIKYLSDGSAATIPVSALLDAPKTALKLDDR